MTEKSFSPEKIEIVKLLRRKSNPSSVSGRPLRTTRVLKGSSSLLNWSHAFTERMGRIWKGSSRLTTCLYCYQVGMVRRMKMKLWWKDHRSVRFPQQRRTSWIIYHWLTQAIMKSSKSLLPGWATLPERMVGIWRGSSPLTAFAFFCHLGINRRWNFADRTIGRLCHCR